MLVGVGSPAGGSVMISISFSVCTTTELLYMLFDISGQYQVDKCTRTACEQKKKKKRAKKYNLVIFVNVDIIVCMYVID